MIILQVVNLLSIGGGIIPPDTQSPIHAWYMITDLMQKLTAVDDEDDGLFPMYRCSFVVVTLGWGMEVTDVATTWLSITTLTPSVGDQEKIIFK